jgi:hypothetical protein
VFGHAFTVLPLSHADVAACEIVALVHGPRPSTLKNVPLTVIPLQSTAHTCSCGAPVLQLPGMGPLLNAVAVHGVTERFDAAGRVIGYMQLPVYPAHECATPPERQSALPSGAAP